jgi:hypothetical protein
VIPQERQAINGRTFDRQWEPRAVEHHRRTSSVLDIVLSIALACAIGVSLALLGWLELTGRI